MSFAVDETLDGHDDMITVVKFSPDGKKLATACLYCSLTYSNPAADKTIIIWSMDEKDESIHLNGHGAGISALAWASDCRHLVSASDDSFVILWDTAPDAPLAKVFTYKGHHGPVLSVTIDDDCTRILSGGVDETARLWSIGYKTLNEPPDAREWRSLHTFRAHTGPVSGVVLVRTESGSRAITTDTYGVIRMWDVMTKACLSSVLLTSEHGVVSATLSPNRQVLVTSCLGSVVKLFKIHDTGLAECREFKGHHTCMSSFMPVCVLSTESQLMGPQQLILVGSEQPSFKPTEQANMEVAIYDCMVDDSKSAYLDNVLFWSSLRAVALDAHGNTVAIGLRSQVAVGPGKKKASTDVVALATR